MEDQFKYIRSRLELTAWNAHVKQRFIRDSDQPHNCPDYLQNHNIYSFSFFNTTRLRWVLGGMVIVWLSLVRILYCKCSNLLAECDGQQSFCGVSNKSKMCSVIDVGCHIIHCSEHSSLKNYLPPCYLLRSPFSQDMTLWMNKDGLNSLWERWQLCSKLTH